MVIFHSYVNLPEGITQETHGKPSNPWDLHWAADQKVETLQGCDILVLRMGQNPGTFCSPQNRLGFMDVHPTKNVSIGSWPKPI